MLFHSFELPWSLIQEEVERLKRLVVVFLAVTVVIGLIIPFIPVPKKDLSKEEKLPPRLAQLVMQQKEKPKPTTENRKERREEREKEGREEKGKEKRKTEERREESREKA